MTEHLETQANDELEAAQRAAEQDKLRLVEELLARQKRVESVVHRQGHDGPGARRPRIDRAGEARLPSEGEARGAALERLRGVSVVVAPAGTIRTVGHRTRRLRRH